VALRPRHASGPTRHRGSRSRAGSRLALREHAEVLGRSPRAELADARPRLPSGIGRAADGARTCLFGSAAEGRAASRLRTSAESRTSSRVRPASARGTRASAPGPGSPRRGPSRRTAAAVRSRSASRAGPPRLTDRTPPRSPTPPFCRARGRGSFFVRSVPSGDPGVPRTPRGRARMPFHS
jgi:hypothetical protein